MHMLRSNLLRNEEHITECKYVTGRFVHQIEQSLAPNAADTSGTWRVCKFNRAACNASQLQFLQGNNGHIPCLSCLVDHILRQ